MFYLFVCELMISLGVKVLHVCVLINSGEFGSGSYDFISADKRCMPVTALLLSLLPLHLLLW